MEHFGRSLAPIVWAVTWTRYTLAEGLERLTVNAKVATELSPIPASSDKLESRGRQMKQCWIHKVHYTRPNGRIKETQLYTQAEFMNIQCQ